MKMIFARADGKIVSGRGIGEYVYCHPDVGCIRLKGDKLTQFTLLGNTTWSDSDGNFLWSSSEEAKLYFEKNSKKTFTPQTVERVDVLASTSTGPSASNFVKGTLLAGAAVGAAAAMATMGSEHTVKVTWRDDDGSKESIITFYHGEGFQTFIGQLGSLMNQPNEERPGLSSPVISSADEILKFKKLMDEGVISQAEFDAKKKQLLGLSGIKEIDTPKETVVIGANADAEMLLKRAFMFLEDGEWSKADAYCEQVLNQDPENAEAYLGKLMAELCVRRQEDLPNCEQPFNTSNNYQKAVRFGDEKFAGVLSEYINHINKRNENTRLTDIYDNAVSVMKGANSESAYKDVAEIFKTISGFKDSDELAEQCFERAEVCRKDSIYASAMSQKAENTVSGYDAAIKTFQKIPGWKDADEQIYACQKMREELKVKEEAERLERERQAEQSRIAAEAAAKKRKNIIIIVSSIAIVSIVLFIVLTKVIIPNMKYNSAVQLYNVGEYEEAIVAFKELSVYRDSEEQISKCELAIKDTKYNSAMALIDSDDYDGALSLLEGLNYKDSADKAGECWYMKQKSGLTNITVGSTIKFGLYEYDNNESNGKEEIEWIVLAVDGDKALIISKIILDGQPYDSADTNTTWEKCSLRTWLNGTFYNSAFSSAHQKIIISSQISEDIYNGYSYRISQTNSMTDRVFLLSNGEALKYFSSNSARECRGIPTSTGNWFSWWLRSSGTEPQRAAYVNSDGELEIDGLRVSRSNGVRPAMWIDIGS